MFRLSLLWQLLIPSTAAIVISVVVVQLWTLDVSQQALEHRMSRSLDASMALLKAYLQPLGTEWSRDNGQLRLGASALAGLNSLIDDAAAASGGVATIFSGDERIVTNVVKPDGARAVGTKLTDAAVREAVLGQGRPFRGTSSILGHNYITLYEPIRDRAGQVVGILFSGLPTTELDEEKANVVLQGAIAASIAVVIFVMACAWLLRLSLRPLNRLADATGAIAGGDLSTIIPATERSDQIGTMAVALQAFKDSASDKLRLEAESAATHDAHERQRRQHETQLHEHAQAQMAVVNGLAAGLERLAAGDLSCRLETAFGAEYEALRSNYNVAAEQLHRLVTGIKTTISDVDAGAREITQASDDLSKRTEENAASLEQAAAALQMMTTAVRQNADSARQVQDAIMRTRSGAERSGEVVTRAVSAMSEIKASSERVGQISGVINEIAFQTNLLALNAGVEAARAGDAGRGFAVVASEVRALAQRSATAAKEINEIISAATAQADAGVALVGETGEALSEIVADVGTISGLVVSIATSATEQATGLSEVSVAVDAMDRATQQNAAMVEQSAAASHALADKANHLAELTSHFKLGHTDHEARLAPRGALRLAAIGFA